MNGWKPYRPLADRVNLRLDGQVVGFVTAHGDIVTGEAFYRAYSFRSGSGVGPFRSFEAAGLWALSQRPAPRYWRGTRRAL